MPTAQIQDNGEKNVAVLRNMTSKKNYMVVSKIFLQDVKLSMKARGLLATLHSLPDNWEYTHSGMAKILPDGRDSIRNAMEELVERGYVRKEQDRSGKGTFGNIILEIHENPIAEKPLTENPTTDKPITGNPP